MNARLIAIPLLALATVSCDKASKLASDASASAKRMMNGKKQSSAGEVDPALKKLVDQTAEGAVFRKDLPFPKRLEVRTTRRSEIAGRFFQTSAIGKQAENINGTRTQTSKLERTETQVRYTHEQSTFTIPSKDKPEEGPKAVANPLETTAPSNKPITFLKSGASWKCDEAEGFRAIVLSKQLSPVFDHLLVDNALSPRPLWFGKRRMKIGEQIIATGESLAMIVAGDAKGSITLKLEAFEPVEGHPCGVFSVKGDYSRKKFPDFDGKITDEEVTIQSGKMWFSLIHPIILKEELDTVQTFKSGGYGGLEGRVQGTVKVSVTRTWKIPSA
jgi:hypothetical protein